MSDFDIPGSVHSQEEERQFLVDIGLRIGEHRAFGFLAHRCTAADAECLKRIRDSRDYQTLGYTWKDFCSAELGISQPHADKLIRNLEEFGANFFRLAELVQISPQTYRLIASSISGDTIEFEGEKVPLNQQHRGRIAQIVRCFRRQADAETGRGPVDIARRKFAELMGELYGLTAVASERPALHRLSLTMTNCFATFQQLLERPLPELPPPPPGRPSADGKKKTLFSPSGDPPQ